MKWAFIHKILEHEASSAFGAIAVQTAGMTLSEMEAALQKPYKDQLLEISQREVRHRSDVDAACRYFASKRRWPLLTAETAEIAMIRVFAAKQFVDFLRAQETLGERAAFPAFQNSVSTESVLLVLLVDYWHFAGLQRWLHGAANPRDSDAS